MDKLINKLNNTVNEYAKAYYPEEYKPTAAEASRGKPVDVSPPEGWEPKTDEQEDEYIKALDL